MNPSLQLPCLGSRSITGSAVRLNTVVPTPRRIKKEYFELKSSEWLVASAWQAFRIVLTGFNLFGMEGDAILGGDGEGGRQLSQGRRLLGKEENLYCALVLTLALSWTAAFLSPRTY